MTEKVEINIGRLDIYDLEEEIEDLNAELEWEMLNCEGDDKYRRNAKKYFHIPNAPSEYTGGYLIVETISSYYNNTPSGFVTRRGQAFIIKEPKYVTKEGIEYIAGLFQKIADVLYSKLDGEKTEEQLSDYLDITTLVNRYLQSEVLDDHDAQVPYLYKDIDSINPLVYYGPVWDQDNILGAAKMHKNPETIRIEGDQSAKYYWFPKVLEHPEIKAALRQEFFNKYEPAVRILLGEKEDDRNILRSIDSYAEEVRFSAEMDLSRWPGSRGTVLSDTGSTFRENVEFLKQYLSQRLPALADYFEGFAP